jgi:hypothetical protein
MGGDVDTTALGANDARAAPVRQQIRWLPLSLCFIDSALSVGTSVWTPRCASMAPRPGDSLRENVCQGTFAGTFTSKDPSCPMCSECSEIFHQYEWPRLQLCTPHSWSPLCFALTANQIDKEAHGAAQPGWALGVVGDKRLSFQKLDVYWY